MDQDGDRPVAEAAPLRTGVEQVDAVILAVEDLGERPVEEHVAVFERAHEALRRALDDPSDSTPDSPVDSSVDSSVDSRA